MAKIPDPTWIPLSVAWGRACDTFNEDKIEEVDRAFRSKIDADEIEVRGVAAAPSPASPRFDNVLLAMAGRVKMREGRDSTSQPELKDKHWRSAIVDWDANAATFDKVTREQALKLWRRNNEGRPEDERLAEPPKMFSESKGKTWGRIEVRRPDLESWFQETATAGETKKGRGRPKGTGSLADLDAPLVSQMKALIATGKAGSVHAAAVLVAPKASGAGTEDSKVRRLTGRYKEAKAELEN